MADAPVPTDDGLVHVGQMLAASYTCTGCAHGFIVMLADAAMVTACPFCRAPMKALIEGSEMVQ